MKKNIYNIISMFSEVLQIELNYRNELVIIVHLGLKYFS
jgi:hypothetical protein